MSTRSGKRIHGSFNENDTSKDIDVGSKTEKKSRRKRSKENIDECNVSVYKHKKRVNYVTYPRDDELVSDIIVTNEDEGRTTRLQRNNALKENNMAVPETNHSESNRDSKKNKRNTRRTKKFAESDAEDISEGVVAEKVSKKGKKKKVASDQAIVDADPGPKKKSKRKKKSTSIIVEEIAEPVTGNGLNKSNMSVDSFHSAAGSPDKLIQHDNKMDDLANEECNKYSVAHSSKTPPTFKADKTLLQSSDKVNSFSPELNMSSGKKSKRKRSAAAVEQVALSTAVNIMVESPKDMETLNSLVVSRNNTDRKVKRKKSLTVQNNVEPNVFNLSEEVSQTVKDLNTSVILKNNSEKKEKRKKSLTVQNNAESNVFSLSEEVSETVKDVMNCPYNEKCGTHDKDTEKPSAKKRKSVAKAFDDLESTTNSERKSSVKDYAISFTTSNNDVNRTHENVIKMETIKRKSSVIESLKDNTFDKIDISSSKVMNVTFDRLSNGLNTTYDAKNTSSTDRSSVKLNSTYDKAPNTPNTTFERKTETLNNTFDKTNPSTSVQVLNSTFDKATPKSFESDNKDLTFDKSSKSSLLTSDDTDKDMSHVSLTSDESQENIINTTPVLIESSLDNTQLDITKTDSPKDTPVTPLRREGTFTKDSSIDIPQVCMEKTPQKRFSLPSPGCTPFHPSSHKDRPVMNFTRSIEKSSRMSLLDVAPKTTKVMFCSPVNNPAVVIQQKRKVIKSNLKGSNKSFVYEDKVTEPAGPAARKRSYTLNDAEDARVKRKRLADDLQQSVDRLSRPRTSSAAAKLEPHTPSSKAVTPSKAKQSRTKLPNFAAMHQKQFEKMESLDECQERKAKRAKKLLTPTSLVDRTVRVPTTTTTHEQMKPVTPTKQLPTLETLKPGYTRFGFKMNMDVNPFSIPSKNAEVKPKENRPNGLKRQATLPSLTGTTSLRREAARQIVLREKSFTDKRNVKRSENRTIIKGVRTNRRFELQMKLRNIE